MSSPAASALVLGRVVSLEDDPRAVRTLADPPDGEVADVERDVAVLLLEDSRLQGYRTSTGALLWERTTAAPCRKLLLAPPKVYAGCGNKVFSFEPTTGAEQLVDAGPGAGNPILVSGGTTVAVLGAAGRVALYRASGGPPTVSKVLPELSRAFQTDIIANPASAGICALGLMSGARRSLTYRAACYDEKLLKQWSQPFVFAADRPISLRQLGPEYLVLDDQESILDPSSAPGPGRGLVVRWRDGKARSFDDGTFATLENVAGDRLQTDSDVFALTRTIGPVDAARFPTRRADVVADQNHVFVLIVNGATGLAGIDRSNGHVLFLNPVSVGTVWTVQLVGGMPIVRSRYDDRWEVSIYDAVTGRVRYHDARPRTRSPQR